LVAVTAGPLKVTTIVDCTPTRRALEPTDALTDVTSPPLVVPSSIPAALEGATESIPKPKAATATRAMRLKVVFVDICFLSLVDPEDFSKSAW